MGVEIVIATPGKIGHNTHDIYYTYTTLYANIYVILNLYRSSDRPPGGRHHQPAPRDLPSP